jgi:uncharacterized membrane protein
VASKSRRIDVGALAAIGMAIGLCGVGALSLVHRDFALVWEPVPASLRHRSAWALASGLILVASGVMMLFRRTRPWGAALAAAFLGLWVVALHLPTALAKPLVVGNWQAVCESLAMATGAFFAIREPKGAAGRVAIVVMGVCYVVFGVSHFAYAKFTTAMVPPFLPMRPQLTYLTGAIHLLTGLAIVSGVRRRWAAIAEAAMMSSFVLLVHIPRVAAHPHDRMEQTALFIAITLTSAAWILAISRAIAKR